MCAVHHSSPLGLGTKSEKIQSRNWRLMQCALIETKLVLPTQSLPSFVIFGPLRMGTSCFDSLKDSLICKPEGILCVLFALKHVYVHLDLLFHRHRSRSTWLPGGTDQIVFFFKNDNLDPRWWLIEHDKPAGGKEGEAPCHSVKSPCCLSKSIKIDTKVFTLSLYLFLHTRGTTKIQVSWEPFYHYCLWAMRAAFNFAFIFSTFFLSLYPLGLTAAVSFYASWIAFSFFFVLSILKRA